VIRLQLITFSLGRSSGPPLAESVLRDHVRAKLLRVLAVAIGKDLRRFRVMTRIREPLSETATVFGEHLRRYAADRPVF
jgi:hypothetical protein